MEVGIPLLICVRKNVMKSLLANAKPVFLLSVSFFLVALGVSDLVYPKTKITRDVTIVGDLKIVSPDGGSCVVLRANRFGTGVWVEDTASGAYATVYALMGRSRVSVGDREEFRSLDIAGHWPKTDGKQPRYGTDEDHFFDTIAN